MAPPFILFDTRTVGELVEVLRQWESHALECRQCQDFDNDGVIPMMPLSPPCLEGSKILQRLKFLLVAGA